MKYKIAPLMPSNKPSCRTRFILLSFLPASFLLPAEAFEPATLSPSQSDFGGVGLMQIPTGRMAREGEFNFGVNISDEYHHASINLQLLPWFESTIRYTMVQDLLFSDNASYSGDTKYTDKGIDFKVRLVRESYWLPETSFGVRDFGGTGLFDGEYIAASKRFASFDFTLGIGWGYLGQSGNIANPFCKANTSFCQRDSSYQGKGGSVDYQRWFKGASSLFGGVEYQTPYKPLRLKLEYEGNDYSQDFPVTNGNIDMNQRTPVNIGILYKPVDWVDFKLSYQRGTNIVFGVNLTTNFNDIKPQWRDKKKPDYLPRASAHSPNWQELANQLESNAGYNNVDLSLSDSNILIQGEQTKYRNLDSAHERAGLLLSQYRNQSVKSYTMVETKKGLIVSQTAFDANHFDKVTNHEYIGAKLSDAKIKMEDQQIEQINQKSAIASTYQPLSYGIAPTLAQSFGGPESFYLYAIGATANATYKLTTNLELSGSLYLNIIDNYDQFSYVQESPHIDNFATPRVRTLFRAYVDDNPIRMTNLQLTWFDQLDDNFFFQGYAGYLESIFAGVGGEVLYRQADRNWALGVDANFISQRDPNNWFKTYSDDYFIYDAGCVNNVLTPSCSARVLPKGQTGFVSLYYMPEWAQLRSTLLKLGFGQFLGQDKGVRFDVSKQFNSGIIAGVYANFSNLTAEEYGEGSFTKGFYISIPFDILTIKPSTQRASFAWQPITRDGGQTLNRKYQLFNITDSRSPWFTRPVNNNKPSIQ